MSARKSSKFIDVEESERRLKETLEEEQLEKGDLPALIAAAFLVYFPFILLIAAVCFGVYLLFVH